MKDGRITSWLAGRSQLGEGTISPTIRGGEAGGEDRKLGSDLTEARAQIAELVRTPHRRRQLLHKALLLLVAIGSVLLSVPAWAGYVDVTYSGTVDQVGPGGPASVTVGTPIAFNVVFDPSTLVDYTTTVNAAFSALFPAGSAFNSVQTASLAGDPLASLTITVGGITFGKGDEVNYGTPCGDTPLSSCKNPTSPTGGLGAGNLPDVEYINGSFAGVGNLFINSQGYTLDADPIADAGMRAARGHAFRVTSPGDFDFALSVGTAASPFAQEFAAGDIDLSSVRISAVPEPAAWTLFLAGIASMAGLRRMARRGGQARS